MWNYVQMDDGNWYLVDATWDDVGTSPSSRYLLVGRATKGQYITIGEERVEYTSFSTTSAETAGPVFILPVLAEESYADNKGKNEPAVTVVPTVTPTAAVSAGPTPTASAEPAPTVSVAPIPTATPTPTTTTLTLRVKQTYKSGGKIKSVRTTNKKIVKVDKKGKITGKKAGKATVTITYTNGSRRIYQVKVQKGIVKTIAVSVNKRNIILAKKGKSFQLRVTLTPVTSQQKVTYKSSNSKVAAVNSKGKIVAKKKGTATITVKSGNKKITCKVKVKK